MGEKVEVRNVNHPDLRERVDAEKYGIVRTAMMAVLTEDAPGLTAKELKAALAPEVERTFPGGAKLGWWMTTVRLDLEARGLIARSAGSPLRFRKTG